MRELTRLDLAILNAVRRRRLSIAFRKARPNIRIRWVKKHTTWQLAIVALNGLIDAGLVEMGPGKFVCSSNEYQPSLTPLGARFIQARLQKAKAA